MESSYNLEPLRNLPIPAYKKKCIWSCPGGHTATFYFCECYDNELFFKTRHDEIAIKSVFKEMDDDYTWGDDLSLEYKRWRRFYYPNKSMRTESLLYSKWLKPPTPQISSSLNIPDTSEMPNNQETPNTWESPSIQLNPGAPVILGTMKISSFSDILKYIQGLPPILHTLQSPETPSSAEIYNTMEKSITKEILDMLDSADEPLLNLMEISTIKKKLYTSKTACSSKMPNTHEIPDKSESSDILEVLNTKISRNLELSDLNVSSAPETSNIERSLKTSNIREPKSESPSTPETSNSSETSNTFETPSTPEISSTPKARNITKLFNFPEIVVDTKN